MTNAGQANAATGDQGYADAVECAKLLAKALNITPDDVLLQSTGTRTHTDTHTHKHTLNTYTQARTHPHTHTQATMQTKPSSLSVLSMRGLLCVCVCVCVCVCRRCDRSSYEDGGVCPSYS